MPARRNKHLDVSGVLRESGLSGGVYVLESGSRVPIHVGAWDPAESALQLCSWRWGRLLPWVFIIRREISGGKHA